MDLALRTKYWDDPEARAAFKEFMVTIHNLDLSEWEKGGYWDSAYTPFSFFSGKRVVSSICVYSLDAVIHGKILRVAQISGVGTLPEWRRKGLNRRLTDAGLNWAREGHGGVFLFADTDAVPFYQACGFSSIDEYVEHVEPETVTRSPGLVKLDPGKGRQLEKIYGYARQRAPVSNEFGVLNAKLLMFHSLHSLRNHVYEIPDLECLVFFKREEGCLKIFDVVGQRVPPLKDLYPYVADKTDGIVELHFFGDKLAPRNRRVQPLRGNNPFVKGPFPIERPVFPFTCRA